MKRLLLFAFSAWLFACPSAFAAPRARAVASPQVAASASAAAGAAESVGVIVRFKSSSDSTLAAKLISAVTSSSASPVNAKRGLWAFRTPSTDTAQLYSAKLMLDSSAIAYAEPNYVRHVEAYSAPTDPDFTDSTAWSDGVGYYLGGKHWWLDAMTAPAAWAIGQGSTYPVRASASDIKVAVLDTGMYLNHQEFNGGTVVVGKDEAASYDPNTGIYTTDYDITPDATTNASFAMHGTGTTAAIGAEINSLGMVGIGYNAQVRCYKVGGPISAPWGGYPAGSILLLDSAGANGIYDAVADGCKVINISIGGANYSQTYQDAIAYAHSQGVVVCASAGNDGKAVVDYPAACTYAVGVAAVERSGGSWSSNGTITRSSFSNYGAGVNDLTAPGTLVWTADQPGYDSDGTGTAAVPGYQFWNGTSFSSPAVVGAIAYLWRAMPSLTNDEIVSRVESSAVDLGSTGRDDNYGYGLVDMAATYNKMIADYPMLATPTVAAQYVKPSADVTWTASSGYNVNYAISVDGALRSTQTSTTYALPGLPDGTHLISVLPTSTRNWNTTSLATKTVTVDSVAPVVSGFSQSTSTVAWSVAETNPYSVQAYVDTATPSTVASNSLSIVGVGTGAHTLHVDATDAAGNTSGWVTWGFSVGATGTLSVPSVVTTDALSATLTWLPVNGAVSYDYTVDGGAISNTASTSVTLTGLTGGVTTVQVRTVAADTSTGSWVTATVTDNVVVPGVPSLSAPANVATPSVTVSWPAAAGALTYQWRLDGGTATSTVATSVVVGGIAQGSHTIEVRSLDNLASSAWATATVAYAVTSPAPASVVVTDALSATVSWSAVPGAASYEYSINGGSTLATAGTSFVAAGLTGGVVPVQLRSVRSNGDRSVWATATITDNVVVPDVPTLNAASYTPTSSVVATWPASANALSYEWRLNGGTATATASRSATVAGLAIGANTIEVRALDNLSSSAWASASVTYVPAPALASVVVTDALSATVSWPAIVGASGYEYAINGGPTLATGGPSFVATGLAGGTLPIQARTVLATGDRSSWATATITDNVVVPAVPGISAPANVATPSVTATWAPAANALSYEYRLNGGSSASTTATGVTLPGLLLGMNGVSVRSHNNLSASSWATVTVTYAVTPPAPASVTVTDALAATVSWPAVSGAASYEYRINAGSTLSTGGLSCVATGLAGGVVTVQVRTVRANGDRSSWAYATITDVVVVPDPPLLSAPTSVTLPSVAVSWPAAANALSYEWRLNGGTATATSATSVTVSGLQGGSNTIEVRSLDNLAASAWATATVTYVVTTPIISAPAEVWTPTATITWTPVPGATGYEYAVGAASPSSTTATSAVVGGLVYGANLVTVRALQGATPSAWASATILYSPPAATTLTLSPTTATVAYPATSTVLSGLLSAPNSSFRVQSSADASSWSDVGITLTTTATPAARSFTLPVSANTYVRLVFDGDNRWAASASQVATITYLPSVDAPVLSSFTVTDTLSAVVAWAPVAHAGSYEYRVNAGSTQATSGPSFATSALSPGANTVEARTVESGTGRTSAWATATVTVAVIVPSVPAISLPTTSGVPHVSASWPAATGALGYEYRLDAGSTLATSATSLQLALATAGTHTLEVRAVDNLASSAWATAKVDYQVPAPVLAAPATVRATTATVSWAAIPEADSYEYTLNGGAAQATSGTAFLASGLLFGDNAVAVRALQGPNASAWATATIVYLRPGQASARLVPLAAAVTYPVARASFSAFAEAPGQGVRLQRSFDGVSWSDTGTSWTTTSTPATLTISVAATRTASYRLATQGDATWAATSSPVVVVGYAPSLAAIKMPGSVRRRQKFTITEITSQPARNSASTVTFLFQRWQMVQGVYTWVLRSSVRVRGVAVSGTSTRYRTSASLPNSGSWRIIASYSGAPLYADASSAALSFRVR